MQREQVQKLNKVDIKSFFNGKNCSIPTKSVEASIEFLQIYGYDQIQLIDAGAFGLVMKAIDSQNGNRVVAIKLMIVTDSETLKHNIKEYQRCVLINHPHVVKNFQQLYDEDNECYFIISEFCTKGNLFNYSKQNKLNCEEIIIFTLQILEGLKGIHDKNIIHSDLKPQNILIQEDGSIKICDLGLSKHLFGQKSITLNMGGSLDYMSPQQLEGTLSKQCDVYSVGCIICFLCNVNIFGLNMIQVKKGILPPIQNNEFQELLRIAYKMMEVEPKKRIQLLDSIQELQELLKSITHNQKTEYKIIEYDNGNKYEGYVQNGKKNGKGVLHFNETSLYKKYQGDWLNDKMEGYGVFEFKNGDIYEGYLINNCFEGKGKCIYNQNSTKRQYDGEWVNNNYEGYGILDLKSGDRYEGNFMKGLKQGKGKYFFNEASKFTYYSGDYLNDVEEGFGILEWKNGKIYEGFIKNKRFNGKGVCQFSENCPELKYDGEWANGKYEGYGVLEFRNGDIYEGNFKDGKYDGKGRILYRESSKYKKYSGDFTDGKMEGYGAFSWKNGNVCEGNLVNNYFNGKAVFSYNDASLYKKYSGDFVKDKMDGYGILEYRSGEIFEGYFKNGKRVDK
ncbi:hypothetical protein ABPG74_014367 [Tetrahymena malaccensis]